MTGEAIWGAPEWAAPALVLLAAGAVALAWSYWRSPAGGAVRTVAAALKITGLAALAMCLVEPLLSGLRPRAGANLFAVAVDDSQSLQIRDRAAKASRGEQLRGALRSDSPWMARLGQGFDVRRFAFDTHLRPLTDFAELTFEGDGSALSTSLAALAKRFRGLPIGGVLLLSDGNATDVTAEDFDWTELPPVFPVIVGSDDPPSDISVERVSASQTNFESAPVAVRVDVRSLGNKPRSITACLLDESENEIQSETQKLPPDEDVASFRFQLRPETAGVSFYHVRAIDADRTDNASDSKAAAAEATLANNERTFVVDRGDGPYRVLYVSGRPNWDFKFLRRALDDDDQLDLVGLLRIAEREPKFTFRPRGQQPSNRLFEGFHRDDEDTAERYDEPVLLRLGTRDDQELRDGFPRAAEDLYTYDALILDDVAAEFFSQDQLTLIENFVSRRGGGFLMLSGGESFTEGSYRRTPVGELLPVYLDRPADQPDGPSDREFRLVLTREGWLQPWVRLHKTEDADRQRLAAMTPFRTTNRVGNLKPGASELAQVVDPHGETRPALVAQRFGRGRSAALLIGDFWRWGLGRVDITNEDLEKSWRQTVRWLVADVPRRIEVEVNRDESAIAGAMTIRVRVHDAKFLPLENANVKVRVRNPDGKEIELRAEASDQEAGGYVATHVSRTPGAYRATVAVTEPDGTAVGEREAGWVAQPLADEFSHLRPNRQLLEEIAAKTDGQIVALDELDEFVASLETRKMPVTEPWIRPLWHHPLFFVFAIICLTGEWGLRRWKGLA